MKNHFLNCTIVTSLTASQLLKPLTEYRDLYRNELFAWQWLLCVIILKFTTPFNANSCWFWKWRKLIGTVPTGCNVLNSAYLVYWQTCLSVEANITYLNIGNLCAPFACRANRFSLKIFAQILQLPVYPFYQFCTSYVFRSNSMRTKQINKRTRVAKVNIWPQNFEKYATL